MWHWYITKQLVHFLILDTVLLLKKIPFTVYALKEENYIIYMKKFPDHNIRREFAVGAVAVISHNIWKSKLYINTEGQLFWYLKTFDDIRVDIF